jgi:hypothetical protein
MIYRIFLSIVLALVALDSYGQDGNMILEIELSKQSRGFQEFVRITPDSMFVLQENRKGTGSAKDFKRAVTEQEWQNLLLLIQRVNLQDLPSLPLPTMNRASDAAMHSTITVKTKDGKSYAHGYDDENPHEALQPLHQAIRDLNDQQ